ncbi:MAG: MarR family transcriptional regulator [Alphaproteobacteria bacterium]|nr:MarR family transcriptional regulator [Alphaproteobacteria bacterium]
MPNKSSISPKNQDALRSWLKLLNTSNQIRKTLQSKLMASYGTSLSRFDVMANLYRAPEKGVRLSDLSKKLMVSNGNVTQVMAPLIREGLVVRTPCPDDARAAMACLTKEGISLFEKMAADHAQWVGEIFAPFSEGEHQQLMNLLGTIDHRKINQE